MLGIPETAFSELHWYERLNLRIRAALDVRRGRFQSNEYQSLADPEQTRTAASSPFTIMEVRRFAGKRDRYLGKKRHLYWNFSKRMYRRYRYSRFITMLRDLDDRIATLSTDINIDIMRTDDMLDMLQRQRDLHDERNEPHMAQLCVNKADKLRSEYYARNISKYQGVQSLLNEKISRLETAHAYLTAIRRQFYLRLAYYYYRASNRDLSLNHADLSEEQLGMMGDLGVMDQFQNELKDAYANRDKIEKDISVLSSWRT